MSKLIEIVVVGPVGSGKSHILALIDKALREGYGPHTKIVSRELSQERGLGGPSTEPLADTIFDLKERGPISDSIISRLKVEVDTSHIDAALVKAEALSVATAGLESGQAVEGCFVIDPLESAIQSTVSILRDERESQAFPSDWPATLYARFDNHLDELLRMQLDKLKG